MEGIAIGILVAYPLTNNVGNGFAALSQRRQPLIYTSYYTMPRVKVKLETAAWTRDTKLNHLTLTAENQSSLWTSGVVAS